jgi:two-component system chemotaxis response regulator CheY
MAKILIVDDSLISRISLKKILTAEGHEIIGESVNGVDACLKYVDLQPDLVTMDITMPEMDGLEALRRIMYFDPNAQVVMISALGQESKILEALNDGAMEYITKPYETEQVISIINDLFSLVE